LFWNLKADRIAAFRILIESATDAAYLQVQRATPFISSPTSSEASSNNGSAATAAIAASLIWMCSGGNPPLRMDPADFWAHVPPE
jgi:hypothetical protein